MRTRVPSQLLSFEVALAVLALAGCSRTASTPAASGDGPAIRVVEYGGARAAVQVVGLPRADLAALRAHPPGAADWAALLRVSVVAGSPDGDSADVPAMAGSYSIAGGALQFVPELPFDPRHRYRVALDPRPLPENAS